MTALELFRLKADGEMNKTAIPDIGTGLTLAAFAINGVRGEAYLQTEVSDVDFTLAIRSIDVGNGNTGSGALKAPALLTVPGYVYHVSSMAVSIDGNYIFIVARDLADNGSRIIKISIDSGEIVADTSEYAGVYFARLMVSPDDLRVYAVPSSGGKVYAFDASLSPVTVATITTHTAVDDAALSNDGTLLAVCANGGSLIAGSVHLINTTTFTVTRVATSYVVGIDFVKGSADHLFLFNYNRSDPFNLPGQITVCDLSLAVSATYTPLTGSGFVGKVDPVSGLIFGYVDTGVMFVFNTFTQTVRTFAVTNGGAAVQFDRTRAS